MLDLIISAIDDRCSDAYIFDWSYNAELERFVYNGEFFDSIDYESVEAWIDEIVLTVNLES